MGAILTAWVKGLWKKKKQEHKADDAVKLCVQILMRKEIEKVCDKWLALGHIPIDKSEAVLDEINEMYKPYKDIDGNSTGDIKYQQLTALPIKDTDKEAR